MGNVLNNMKNLTVFALLVSAVTAAAVGNIGFSCPDQSWGGCCAEVDEYGGGHNCQNATTVASKSEYICSNNTEYGKCCHYAPWVVHDAHPLVCSRYAVSGTWTQLYC